MPVSAGLLESPRSDAQDGDRDDANVHAKVCCESSRFARVVPHEWGIAAIVACTVFLYAPSVEYDFVNWDDPWYVLNNPLVKSWHPANLYKVATQVSVKNFAPVTIFSYLVDHTLWGTWAGGYHFTNILLHAANALLVYRLLWQLSGKRFIAFTAALLFAVHPIQIESVVWISSRKGLLSTTFILMSLLCWMRREREARHEGWGILWLAAALLSKANAIVVPPVVLMYDVLVCRRAFAPSLVRQFIPGMLSLLLLLTTIGAQTTEIGGVRTHMHLGKAHILAVDSIILWRYVGMLVYPADLCVLYDPPTTGIAALAVVAAAGWIAVAASAYRLRRSHPWFALALFAFVAFLFPVLNLFPISTLMNDRYMYVSCIPLFGLWGYGLDWLAGLPVRRRLPLDAAIRVPRAGLWPPVSSAAAEVPVTSTAGRRQPPVAPSAVFRAAAIAAAIVPALALAQLTHEHLPVWTNSRTLWAHAREHAPQLAVVQIQWSDTLHALGDDAGAMAALQTALADCQPDALDRRRIREKMAALGR